jgi:hypothetical protein
MPIAYRHNPPNPFIFLLVWIMNFHPRNSKNFQDFEHIDLGNFNELYASNHIIGSKSHETYYKDKT